MIKILSLFTQEQLLVLKKDVDGNYKGTYPNCKHSVWIN